MPTQCHRRPTADSTGEDFSAISRRSALHTLALALAVLPAGELLADEGEPPSSLMPPEPPPVRFLDAAALRHAIRTAPEEVPGQPGLYSLDLAAGAGYPVIGIRRTVPTRSELHAAFTDVWYVLGGSATLVTGGTIVEGQDTGPGEIRGESISGGEVRRVRSGDFAIIPAGTPHWVSRVRASELLYLVVKVPVRPA
jgi:mannose-6-phosphate isomerase-like protein (cupin superfamily)